MILDCAPTPKATKALYNILRYIQPDDQIISLAIEFLPPFCRVCHYISIIFFVYILYFIFLFLIFFFHYSFF